MMNRVLRKTAVALLASMTFAAACAAAVPSSDPAVRTSTLTPQPIAPGFEKIGPVAKNLWPFSALPVYDPSLKTDVVYISSFNSAGFGQLIRLDYRHNKATSWTLPAGIGSWGIIQGKDGRIYLGSYNEGKLLCFDPRAGTWVSLPQMSDEFRKAQSIICALVQAPDGRIYYGTYPGAHLVRYDPQTRSVEDLGRAADESYLRQLAVTPEGIILCGVGTRHPHIVTYDPRTRQFKDLPPPSGQTSGVINKPLVTSQFVLQPNGEGVAVYDARTLALLHWFPLQKAGSFNVQDATHMLFRSGSEVRSLDLRNGTSTLYYTLPENLSGNGWYLTPEGDLFGLHIQSYDYIDVKTHQAQRHSIPVDGLGQDVLWLRSAPDGTIYGGPELGQTMFRYSPADHQLYSYDQVVSHGGEIYYGIPYKGRMYTISYIEATLAVYDPSLPWKWGNGRDANPRTILSVPDRQYRPIGGIHLGPGDRMYIGTQPDYGLLGGALSEFDPVTEHINVYRNIFPDEEIGAVATDDRYVYGEADRGGGGGSSPTATGTHFFVWDPAQHKVLFDQLFPDGHSFSAITTSNGHAYFVVDDHLWDYDRSARKLNDLLTLQGHRNVPLESLQAAADGTLWMLAGHALAHVDPSKRSVEFFPETEGKGAFGLTIGKDGAIYFGSKTDVWVYHPKQPSPPASFDR